VQTPAEERWEGLGQCKQKQTRVQWVNFGLAHILWTSFMDDALQMVHLKQQKSQSAAI